MTEEEIACELIHILSANYGIFSNHIIAAMRDQALLNSVGIKTMKVVYTDMLDIGCFSDTNDHVGEHFQTLHLFEFCNAWTMLLSHSVKARLLWKKQSGKAMASYSMDY